MASPVPAPKDLRAALDAGVIDAPTYRRLVDFLAAPRSEAPSRFDFVNLLWYLGALIVLGAMGLFSTNAFGLWGAKALLATSIGYAAIFLFTGAYLWKWRGLRTPGGLLIACAVGMTPLFVYAVQSMTGHDPIDAVP